MFDRNFSFISFKNIFYDKIDLKLFCFHVTNREDNILPCFCQNSSKVPLNEAEDHLL